MRFDVSLSIALTVAACASLSACGGNEEPVPTLRKTDLGIVKGNDDAAASGTYSWKGIPFAKAPVGALRWKAPVEPDAWGDMVA